jgi:hypothetical protein
VKIKRRHHDDEDEKLTRRQKIELAASIYSLLVDGSSPDDIMDELGITAQHYSIATKYLLQSKGDEEERLTPKERFARYLIDQERNLSDLSDLVTNLNSKTQYSVIVGAIRMRSEIADRIISTGQTLGVISKEPERRLLLGGISITDLKDTDLRKGVLDAIGGLSKMIDKYGTGANVRELTPGPLHHGEGAVDALPAALGKPSMVEASSDKKNRARSGKRAAGRRRVK